jgi:Na+/H+ antiporter NhaD/arsenite permease-like protein
LSATLLSEFDPGVYLSLAFLFGIAAQFRAMDGYSFLRRVLASIEPRVGIVFGVALVTIVASPFILNDVLVLILTPALIKYAKQYDLDAAPLIVTEITFTNLASSLTPIGNPQNILLWTSSRVGFGAFVVGTSVFLLPSAFIVILALLPIARRMGGPREAPTSVGPKGPAIYLGIVTATILGGDSLGLAPYVPLGVAFIIGFAFTYRDPSSLRREFDIRSLGILYAFVASTSVASYYLMPALAPAVVPAARGDQPYSGAFVAVVSNVISNVPATQLLINTAGVSSLLAPKIAVEAGLAGNLGPVGSFANLLALQMAARAGVSLKRMMGLQAVIGVLSYLPALI